MLTTFKYRLYPSPHQARLLDRTLETCRRWYNACLAERKDAWETEKRSIGKFEQLAEVKSYRKENPFAGQVHSHVLQVVTADLDKAFQAFFRRLKAGETPGYPRFRGRDRYDSFGLKEYGNGFRFDGRRLKLSGIGRVAVRWHRPIAGQIKTVRIRRQAGKWYACFACEIEAQPLPPTGLEVGIDVGIASLFTTSDGEHIENPQWYRAEQAGLRVLQRRVSRRKKGGANRRKAVRALQQEHERIANQRADFLKKVVHGLIIHYDRIAIEGLQIVNMAQNHRLAKGILDAGWGTSVNNSLSRQHAPGRRLWQSALPIHRKLAQGAARFLKTSRWQIVGFAASVACRWTETKTQHVICSGWDATCGAERGRFRRTCPKKLRRFSVSRVSLTSSR